jgi:predicted AAA+ superfamily ATPase
MCATAAVVHDLLGIEDFNELAGHPVMGSSWEGFAENLLAAAPDRTAASFYRTGGGAEIDLVLDVPKAGRWAIEIKRSVAAKPDKGFHIACEDIEPEKRLVVYSGEDRYRASPELEVIGLRELMETLAAA